MTSIERLGRCRVTKDLTRLLLRELFASSAGSDDPVVRDAYAKQQTDLPETAEFLRSLGVLATHPHMQATELQHAVLEATTVKIEESGLQPYLTSDRWDEYATAIWATVTNPDADVTHAGIVERVLAVLSKQLYDPLEANDVLSSEQRSRLSANLALDIGHILTKLRYGTYTGDQAMALVCAAVGWHARELGCDHAKAVFDRVLRVDDGIWDCIGPYVPE